jgi:Lecithin retinol acyltransferase
MSRCPALSVDRDMPPNGHRALPLGSHLITPRGAYVHHGIYVGNGQVVHYGGLVRGLRAGPIEAVSVEQFTQGRPLRVLFESSRFSSAEIVQRALSRVGEDRYRVLTNNCEHFCEWCVRGEHRSYQVDRLLSSPLRAFERATIVAGSLWRHGTGSLAGKVWLSTSSSH